MAYYSPLQTTGAESGKQLAYTVIMNFTEILIISSWPPLQKISILPRSEKDRDTGLHLQILFQNMVLIRKIIVTHPFHTQSRDKYNRDDKTSSFMSATTTILEHLYLDIMQMA